MLLVCQCNQRPPLAEMSQAGQRLHAPCSRDTTCLLALSSYRTWCHWLSPTMTGLSMCRYNMTKITQNGGRCRRFALLCFASHCIALLCFAHVWSFLVRIWLDVGGDLVGIWLEWEGIWWEWGELGNAVARSRSGGSQSFFFPRIWLEALETPQHRFSCNLPC